MVEDRKLAILVGVAGLGAIAYLLYKQQTQAQKPLQKTEYYSVEFYPTNDQYARYLIVCVDKDWGSPGCQQWVGDYTYVSFSGKTVKVPGTAKKIVAIVSASPPNYWSVVVSDDKGNVIKKCNYVYSYSPCVVGSETIQTSTTEYWHPTVWMYQQP